ncbi:ATP-binding protein [Nostoc ellipsosporum NOK]|nr:ATP-binding protein [Nostoc ellipsosporum NOK]
MPLLNWIHVLLIGTMLYQATFMLVQWFVFRRKDYLYYILYMGSTLLFLITRLDGVLHFFPKPIPPLIDEYLDQPLIIFACWMYIRFGYHFLELKETQPALYKNARLVEIFFAAFVVAKCICIPFSFSYATSSTIYMIATVALALSAAPLLYKLLAQRNLLNNFLVIGGVCIAIGGTSGHIFTLTADNPEQRTMLVYVAFEVAILLELLLLNTGLVIKNKRTQQQIIDTQNRLILQLQQTEMLRTSLSTMQSKLSSDLHDNIGAGLSSIAMYSQVARQRIEKQPASAAQVLNIISHTASDILSEMKDTIWFIQPANFTFEQLIDRLRQYAEPLCAEKEIHLEFKLPTTVVTELSLGTRKNIFLVLKEAVNNAIKHASPAKITISVECTEEQLIIAVTDDGAGMPPTPARSDGNGLRNMKQRAGSVGGRLELVSVTTGGTKVCLHLPLQVAS